MARAIDLQDTLSKTQAIERVFKVLQQGPELDQRQFAQNLKRAMDEKKEQVRETLKEEETKIRDEEKDRSKEDRYESEEGFSEDKEEVQNASDEILPPSPDRHLDIKI